MSNQSTISNRLFNDPIYGFISIPTGIIFELIEHPYFQRLRRIKQLGLTHLVYLGANHDRFQHALGAMHLMQQAIKTIRDKGNEISGQEEEGVLIAILLHDIGHGPFSHALEHSIVEGVHHEHISLLFMTQLNKEFNGKLDLAIQIFKNEYSKTFLHQLVSSQLDMDRLDYIKRDSYFSGVEDGEIGSERIIKTLNVINDQLVVEAKGIYSVENYLVARMSMYWQVYLHKTVLSAEFTLMNVLKRAKELATQDKEISVNKNFDRFMANSYSKTDFENIEILDCFSKLDDIDVMSAIKIWRYNPDPVLSRLCNILLNRNLLKVDIRNTAFSKDEVANKKKAILQNSDLTEEQLIYFVFTDSIKNSTYNFKQDEINILHKDGTIKEISETADLLNASVVSEPIKKHYLCYLNTPIS
ncbi:MAG: HD domain-containing protein [Flavobacteriales bacterium]|nr:HD domain-containing protein [Flavobacteriales bacterium]